MSEGTSVQETIEKHDTGGRDVASPEARVVGQLIGEDNKAPQTEE